MCSMQYTCFPLRTKPKVPVPQNLAWKISFIQNMGNMIYVIFQGLCVLLNNTIIINCNY